MFPYPLFQMLNGLKKVFFGSMKFCNSGVLRPSFIDWIRRGGGNYGMFDPLLCLHIMATKSGNMKGFYKQKKTTKSAKDTKKKSPAHAMTFGAYVTQPPSLISHGSPDLNDNHDEHEEVLRQFDMNMAYGPCLGMSRLDRWERALKLGKNPPKEVEALLKSDKAGAAECLWEGIV